MLEQYKVIRIFPVFDQLDIPLHLIYCVNIVVGEIICNTYNARNRPIYLISDVLPKLINYEKLKIFFVIKKPVPLFFYFLFPRIQALKACKNGALFLLVIRFILIIIARVAEGVAKWHKEL